MTLEGEILDECDYTHTRARTAFLSQAVFSCLFIWSILLVKSPLSTPTQDPLGQIMFVVITLIAMIEVSNQTGGACFNTTIALAQTLLVATKYDADDETRERVLAYCWVYLCAPVCGGALAGVFQILHEKGLIKAQKCE